ncbi:hypothetical protein NLJ89_g963 [Agrocybe chaxingu]|uniref:Epoxide hydrolase N-terminal domain-containing protein n=1 Tax=Agrocybe chaxingu TaxID=84603 RepID=A0A9W8N114_9AGAR|nr:hypothetical protein NLJ89_g963 [Agrocybe chaxingu]
MSSNPPLQPGRPFKINVPEEKVAALKEKLSYIRDSEELADVGREYGISRADIQRLLARWRDGYDWRKYERELNEELPQYKKDIYVDSFGTLGIHYVEKKSEVKGAIPLLFVHGWPGSFIEVRKILPLLTQKSTEYPSFHVVALSLPGYGFSSAPRKKFSITQYAETGHKLMLSLGYEEYVTQGGDVGFFITRRMTKTYGGQRTKAHSTLLEISPPHLSGSPWLYFVNTLTRYAATKTDHLDSPTAQNADDLRERSTLSQTDGHGIATSPLQLLAWIYEKLLKWSDSYPWDDDEVLTWVSIYWFSAAGPAASLAVYYEMIRAGDRAPAKTTVPLGRPYFPREVLNIPRLSAKTPNLVSVEEASIGGHFAAYEKPQELVIDLRHRPFEIEVTDEQLDLLKKKLALTTFPDELEDAGRDYGAPLADLKRLVARWQDGYDWRKHEKELNDELPQFKKEIHIGGFGDLDIHFVHKTSEVEGAIPLLFVHGWPGSFIEARKILPLLTQASPDHPSFHVVAFSLPGYGFSTAPKKKGFDIAQYAEVGNKLMLSLGYEEYVTQGGDWGAHVSFTPWVYLSSFFKKYTPAEVAGLKRTEWFQKEGRGYNLEQSTQPQTLGYSLADSPSGLLAWIYEKLVNWTDGYPWEDDESEFNSSSSITEQAINSCILL